MASRSTRVVLDNRMVNDFALELVVKHLDHGIWIDKPPDFAGDLSEWGSESNGFLTGTEGRVFYRIAEGASNILELNLSWDNPYWGANSYTYNAWPPGQAHGTGFSVGAVISGTSNHAHVRFVLASGQCAIDPNGNISSFYSLYASLWEKRDGPPFVARHGLTAGQHQQLFTDLPEQGFRPIQVSGFDINGTEFFASIWEKRTGPECLARHGLSATEHQQLFDELSHKGYRMLDVSGYSSGGEALYASIWEKSPGPQWQARHGLNALEHQQTFDELSGEGFRLVHVCGYNVRGQDLYASIYEKRGGPPGFARHNLSASQLNSLADRFPRHRCVCLSGYSVGGRDRYAGIWEKREPGTPSSRRHIRLTSNEHQSEFDDLVQEGFRPTHVCGYGLR